MDLKINKNVILAVEQEKKAQARSLLTGYK